MAKIQLVSAYINLAGSRDNVVFRGGNEAITFAEALVLRAIHGGEEHVHTLIEVGRVDRSVSDEFERLQNIYGEIVAKVFPKIGATASLPAADDQLPTQEQVDVAQAAAAEAMEAARTRVAKKAEKAEKAAADVTPAVAPSTDAAVPSLDDLPQ